MPLCSARRREDGEAKTDFCIKSITAYAVIKVDSPFLKLDNVTLANHRGGDTVNCYSDSPAALLNALHDFIVNGKKPKFLVV